MTLSPDPSLSLEGGTAHERPFSIDSGGSRTPDEPFRGGCSERFVSNDVTELTDTRCLSLFEFDEFVRARDADI